MADVTAREARAWLLTNQSELPEGVTVGNRGRLSAEAKEFFTAKTGQTVAAPVVTSESAE